MKEKNSRTDSRVFANAVVAMDFPDHVRVKVEPLADRFSEIAGNVITFPDAVCICIEYIHHMVIENQESFGLYKDGDQE